MPTLIFFFRYPITLLTRINKNINTDVHLTKWKSILQISHAANWINETEMHEMVAEREKKLAKLEKDFAKINSWLDLNTPNDENEVE